MQLDSTSILHPIHTLLDKWWFITTLTWFCVPTPECVFPLLTLQFHVHLLLSCPAVNPSQSLFTHFYHWLLLTGPQPQSEQGITKPKLNGPSFCIYLCFTHWTTQCVFQTAYNQRLHFQHLAFQSLTNFMAENPSCAIWISGECRCSCPVSLWTPWSARWPATLIPTRAWQHLLSEEWLCPKKNDLHENALNYKLPQQKWNVTAQLPHRTSAYITEQKKWF